VVGALVRNRPAAGTLARSLATLYAAGVPVDWAAVYGPRRYVPLPPVPLARDRYWLPAPGPSPLSVPAPPPAPVPSPVPASVPVNGAGGRPEAEANGGATHGASNGGASNGGPANGGAPQGGRETLVRTVSRLAAQALGYPADRRVPRARGFHELGMDSLTL